MMMTIKVIVMRRMIVKSITSTKNAKHYHVGKFYASVY